MPNPFRRWAQAEAPGGREGSRQAMLVHDPHRQRPSQSAATKASDVDESPIEVGADHYRCEITIRNEMGLHARPASLFVQTANRYQSGVTVQKGNQQADGKSILQLMGLAVEVGTALIVETQGPDARAAASALCELVASGFHDAPAIGGQQPPHP